MTFSRNHGVFVLAGSTHGGLTLQDAQAMLDEKQWFMLTHCSDFRALELDEGFEAGRQVNLHGPMAMFEEMKRSPWPPTEYGRSRSVRMELLPLQDSEDILTRARHSLAESKIWAAMQREAPKRGRRRLQA